MSTQPPKPHRLRIRLTEAQYAKLVDFARIAETPVNDAVGLLIELSRIDVRVDMSSISVSDLDKWLAQATSKIGIACQLLRSKETELATSRGDLPRH